MKKMLGLSLGGGGAKGYFHIGALTALNDYGIKFNAVSGTSIGSIIGATYALGFSPRDMFELIKEMGVFKPSFFITAKIKRLSLEKIIEKVLGERSFTELKIPFSAVATNIDTGESENLVSGNLCKALSASSTIPPAFSYVKIDGKRLIDGGFTNLVPVKAVKNFGATNVLAIDLSAHNPSNASGVKLLDKVYPNHNVKVKNRSNEKTFADVVLEPDLSAFSLISVNKFYYLYEMGYEYVLKSLTTIKEKLKIKLIR